MPLPPTGRSHTGSSSTSHFCQDFTAANLQGDMTSRPTGDDGPSPWRQMPNNLQQGPQEVAMVSMTTESGLPDYLLSSQGDHGSNQMLPQSPGMRERGSNRQHLSDHLWDHDYAKPGLEQTGFPELPGFVNTPAPVHQVFQNPPQSPAPSTETDVHLRVYSEISMDYVVYGTPNVLKKLLEYIDELNTISQRSSEEGGMSAVATLQCKEGVILSKALTIHYPGVYEEGRQYQVICRLGTGTFGSVYRCKDLTTGMEFACKKVSMQSFRRQEVEVLVELMDNSQGARCLPQVFGVLLDHDFVCIMMEYVDNSWHECVKEHKQQGKKIGEEKVVDLLKQSLYGLRHLQLHRVSHCDIKPENMGYNSSGEVKLLDFGTVRLSAEEFTHRGMTPNYMAPEVCRRQNHFNSDMWSLGCTIIYLIVQLHPWYNLDKTTADLIHRIKTCPAQIFEYIVHAENNLGLSPQLADLLRQMLDADPDQRVTAEVALKHSVFKVTRPMSGTLSSIGAVGEDVPTVVPQQASNPQPSGLVYECQTHTQPNTTQQHRPVLRKVTQADLTQLGASNQMALPQNYAHFRRGPPGNGEYPGNGARDEGDSMDVMSEQNEERVALAGKPVKACNFTSGYHTDNSEAISIEVSYKDRVEEFRIPPQQTIGETWPQLKDTAQKLIGKTTGVVAIYEGNRKLDTSTFSEVIQMPRKFSLRILGGNEPT